MKIIHIKSRDNQILKSMRKAAKGGKQLIIEGPKLISEALSAQFEVRYVAVALSFQEKYLELLKGCFDSGARLITVKGRLLSSIADTVTTQGIIALSEPRFHSINNFKLPEKSLLVVLDQIQDPGNMGAIIRSSLGFGASAVVILPGCANPFGAKAVRASAGACLHVPLINCDIDEFTEYVENHKVEVFALTADGDKQIDKTDFEDRCAIIFGNEGSGISSVLLQSSHHRVNIPMDRRLESLNAAISASIVLYEITKRKEQK